MEGGRLQAAGDSVTLNGHDNNLHTLHLAVPNVLSKVVSGSAEDTGICPTTEDVEVLRFSDTLHICFINRAHFTYLIALKPRSSSVNHVGSIFRKLNVKSPILLLVLKQKLQFRCHSKGNKFNPKCKSLKKS